MRETATCHSIFLLFSDIHRRLPVQRAELVNADFGHRFLVVKAVYERHHPTADAIVKPGTVCPKRLVLRSPI